MALIDVKGGMYDDDAGGSPSPELRELIETLSGPASPRELRGEGQLLGVRQSGYSDLKFARLARDRRLIALARGWAERLLDEDREILAPLGHEAQRMTLDEDRRGFA